MDRVKSKVNGIDKRLMTIRRALGKLAKQLTVDNLDILEPKVDQIELLVTQWCLQIETLIDDACQMQWRSKIDHNSKKLIQECLQKKALVILQRLPLSNPSSNPSIKTEWHPPPIDSSEVDFKTEPEEDSEIPIPMDVFAEPSKIKVEELQPHQKPIRKRKRKRGTLRNIAKKRSKPRVSLPASTSIGHEFVCPFQDCSVTFPKRQEHKFEIHKLTHTVPRLMEYFKKRICPVCSLHLSPKTKGSGYSIHLLAHYNIRVLKYPCAFCPKKFWHSSIRANHEEIHHKPSQTYLCDLCPHKTNTLTKLKVHKNKKHAPHRCTECNKPFSCAKTLAKHVKEHTNKVVCQYCGQSMFQRRLYMHIHAKHILRCGLESCKSEFRSLEDLEAHRKEAHTSDFICEACGASFFTEKDLSRHSRTSHNNNITTMTCSWPGCGRVYTIYRKQQFSNHLNRHEVFAKTQNELKNYSGPTYPCEQCGKIYRQQQSLTYHLKSFHVEVEAFKCEVDGCGQAFKTRKSLIQHRGVHGRVASPCPHCPKICSSEAILKSHIITVHKKERDLPFKCQVEGCGESFFRAKYLEVHMGKKHSILQ